MKTKTVKSIIGKKHKAWLESITDEEVRKVAKDGTFVTGGAVASLLMVGDLNDLDIYFRDTYSAIIVSDYYAKMFNKKKNKEAVKLQYADITTSSVEGYGGEDDSVDIDVADAHKFKEATDPIKVFIKSSGVAQDTELLRNEDLKPTTDDDTNVEDTEETRHRPVYFTDNAISLTGKVQLILRFVGSPEQIHENFDFVHCTCWYDPKEKELGLPKEALVSMMTHELVYTGSKFPLCSLFRMRKFIQRGFSVNAGQILKMIFQLQELDLKNPDVLREQLIGVDTTYMLWFLSAYNEWLEENDGEITLNYLTELVDKVFSDDFI